MSEPMSDDKLFVVQNCLAREGGRFKMGPNDTLAMIARIEALTAEIDAAVTRASALGPCADKFCSAVGMNGGLCPDHQLEAGEARATAAIVAYLRDDNGRCDCSARCAGECACGAWDDYKQLPLEVIADRLERGEHLSSHT